MIIISETIPEITDEKGYRLWFTEEAEVALNLFYGVPNLHVKIVYVDGTISKYEEGDIEDFIDDPPYDGIIGYTLYEEGIRLPNLWIVHGSSSDDIKFYTDTEKEAKAFQKRFGYNYSPDMIISVPRAVEHEGLVLNFSHDVIIGKDIRDIPIGCTDDVRKKVRYFLSKEDKDAVIIPHPDSGIMGIIMQEVLSIIPDAKLACLSGNEYLLISHDTDAVVPTSIREGKRFWWVYSIEDIDKIIKEGFQVIINTVKKVGSLVNPIKMYNTVVHDQESVIGYEIIESGFPTENKFSVYRELIRNNRISEMHLIYTSCEEEAYAISLALKSKLAPDYTINIKYRKVK